MTANKLSPVSPDVSFPELEQGVLSIWRTEKTFEKSLEIRKGKEPFLFYDGPPFATGLPHYGHLLQGTLKDIVPRYQTMKGRYVERRFGWDTHGLPVEMAVEKDLGLKGRTDILALGVDKFNEACRASVFTYVKEWRSTSERIGRWVDFDNDYKTLDVPFMESVWWVIKQLWDSGRIYEGKRVMPYSWRLTTPLSNFEAGSNYKEVQDPAVTVAFPVSGEDFSILAWTTTPWTLPSNLALCVHAEFDYAVFSIAGDEKKYLMAEKRLAAYFPKKEGFTVHRTLKGADLVGKSYEPLLPYFKNLAKDGAFKVVADTYVTTEDGTGIVHQAPAYGEDDYRISLKCKVPLVDPIDREGNFTSEVPPLVGKNFKDADKEIIATIKASGRLFRHDVLNHSYPFCERSDTPLMYRAISAWYVKVEDLRDDLVKNNNQVSWIPEFIKEGRFGNWLSQARDWNISRNRFWGNPLPIWRCTSCDKQECVGSKAELEKKSGKALTDLHKQFLDPLVWKCSSCSGEMRRIPEVLDCWFESGSMPYAQLHYPFENKDTFEKGFPADFICEAVDQTRGWFYTLMVLSTALFKKPAFKNVICTGLILAEDGKKMSKRLKNYPEPTKVIDAHGADALRMFMVNSPLVRGDNLRFSEAGVKEVVRQVQLPLWNVYSFFVTYASVDGFKPNPRAKPSTNILDRWILSRLQTLLTKIEKEMASYRLYNVTPALLEFIEEVTNWYVRRSRRRFWSEDIHDKTAGYETLFTLLMGVTKAMAPFMPFITEAMYQNLRRLTPDAPESIHLCDFPVANEALRDPVLEEEMALIVRATELGRALRAKEKIRVRQPLRSMTVVTRNPKHATVLEKHGAHIQEELNVKEIKFSAEESKFVTLLVKPNFPALGPIFGADMKKAIEELKKATPEMIEQIEKGQNLFVVGREVPANLVVIERKAKEKLSIETGGGVTVFYDLTIDETLLGEGLAREFVNRIQKMRKDAQFHVSDRIAVMCHAPETLKSHLAPHNSYIQGETLALELHWISTGELSGGERVEQHEIDDWKFTVAVSRADQ